jgi:hypothetical protein
VGAQAVAISEPDGLRSALAAPSREPVAIAAHAPLSPWIVGAVGAIRAAGRPLVVEVVDVGDVGDARAGREIGLVTALLAAGVAPAEIAGVDPQRVARVAEVVARWHGGGADA